MYVLRDKVRELERDNQRKEAEVKVITNKYNFLREDFSTAQLKHLYDAKAHGEVELE